MVLQQHPRIGIVLISTEQGLGATRIADVDVGCGGHLAVPSRPPDLLHLEGGGGRRSTGRYQRTPDGEVDAVSEEQEGRGWSDLKGGKA